MVFLERGFGVLRGGYEGLLQIKCIAAPAGISRNLEGRMLKCQLLGVGASCFALPEVLLHMREPRVEGSAACSKGRWILGGSSTTQKGSKPKTMGKLMQEVFLQ